MTDFQNLLFEKKNQIAYITLNRPKVLNALNMAVMEELRQARPVKDDVIRVAALPARREVFVAGADIESCAQPGLCRNTRTARRSSTHRELGKPIIACINGLLGGDASWPWLHARLASENAKLGQPEVKLGLIPGYGGTQRLSRLVGKGIAMQLVLTGEMISAQEAHRIGLVNEVVPAAELIPRAEAIAAKIIANAPLAIQYAMEAVNHGLDLPLAEGLYLEATLFGVVCATEDKNEGTQAFLEKRPAQFKGK